MAFESNLNVELATSDTGKNNIPNNNSNVINAASTTENNTNNNIDSSTNTTESATNSNTNSNEQTERTSNNEVTQRKMQDIIEKGYYNERDYSNIGYVEIRYLEMKREIKRVNEKTDALIETLNALIEGINKLASLVDAEQIDGSNIIRTLKGNSYRINEFADGQMSKYEELNEEINERVKRLASELLNSINSNGSINVIVYDDNGNPVEKTHQQVLDDLEKQHYRELAQTALTDSTKEGYREFDGSTWISDALNVSEDRWENFETMYAFFTAKGLTDEQTAGIMANAAGESGFNSEAKNSTSTAKGFFQWLNSRYPESWDVETQLEHAWEELESGLNWGGTSTLSRMQACTTPEQASDTFLQFFEGAGSPVNGPFTGLYPTREVFARDIYNYIQKMKNQ